MKTFTHCPYCLEALDEYESSSEYRKLSCRGRKPDHTFLQSVIKSTDEVSKYVTRIGTDERYYLSINRITGESKVWKGFFNTMDKISIRGEIKIDFDSGLEEVKNKIK